jgi:TolB-like protein/DNA-binding winged helix-turn-helix (wHTH) protein
MRLLMFLAERPGAVVGVEELLGGVWGQTVVTPHSVYEAMAALRQSLEDHTEKPAYIATLPRRGYRLVAPVVASRIHRRERDAPASAPTNGSAGKRETEFVGNTTGVRKPLERRTTVVALILVAAASVAALIWVRTDHRDRFAATSPITQKSIAVLPFVDISEQHDQEYFADGVADDVLDLLVKVPGLRVIARTSSFQFRTKAEDLKSIGAKLGVDFVVEGSVRRSGDDIRVTAQLLSAADGSHLWSETFDRKVSELLQVQSQIAYGIARALDLTITDTDAIARAPLRSVEAYHIYLRGRHAVDRYDRAGFEEGVADFQEALRLEPTFAPAAQWLAWTLTKQAQFAYAAPAAIESGRATALQALRLDPKLAMAHSILASIHLTYDWDWAAADRELGLALDLEPHSVWPVAVASQRAAVFGRWDEAVRYSKEAIALSPLQPGNWESLGYRLVGAGRLDEAQAAFQKALQMRPTIDSAHSLLGTIYLLRGQLEAALAEFEREKNNADGGPNYGGLACVYHALGRHAESDQMLALVAQRGEAVAFYMAEIHAFRGEPDAAFDWLARAYRRRDPGIIFIKADPLLKTLEHDKRYDELLLELHLPR